MKLICTIACKGAQFAIVCVAHKTQSAKSRMIGPQFYKRWCGPGTIPQGEHHELQLMKSEIVNWDVCAVHRHHNKKTRKFFICWTGPLPTLHEAKIIFQMWCVGNVYCYLYAATDFPSMLNPSDLESSFRAMANHYDISATVVEAGSA